MIFSASGGIGHLAVQLAKRLGARVLAVASGADGVALARRLGADAVVNGRTDDVAHRPRVRGRGSRCRPHDRRRRGGERRWRRYAPAGTSPIPTA